jgi:hypothetical protein
MADEGHNSSNPMKEIFDDLFSLLETLETQNFAILQFMKGQGIATDEQLAPYLDQAGNAASVRWRAHRVRMEHLFSPIPAALQDTKNEAKPAAEKEQNEANRSTGQHANGQHANDRRHEIKTEALGTSNPITGRPPATQETTANPDAETVKESKTVEAQAGGAADKKASPSATSSPPPASTASRPDQSESSSEANKPESTAKRA